MPSPPTIVFDLDGTLVDSAPDLMGTLNTILVREGAAPLPIGHARSLIGGGARVLLDRGFAAEGIVLPEERANALYADFLEIYAGRLADETRPFEGVPEALDRLAAAGHRLAVCTNKVTWHSEKLLQLLGLDGRFGAICGRDAFPYAKPDARHLTMAVGAAGGDARQAIMVGDSRTDVATAINAGLPSIVVDFGYTDIPPAELGATRVISHFSELDEAIAAVGAALAA